ncbi:MAG: 2TM domain-containing protein [Archaeoglobales archaeon]|nr:2TM domain-containing protein [Archaeoglobales archaeon]
MDVLQEFKNTWKTIELEEAKNGFLAHLSAYIIINVFLFILNVLISPQTLWFYYVTLGWGIGLAFHFIFSRERFVLSEWEKKAGKIEARIKSSREK